MDLINIQIRNGINFGNIFVFYKLELIFTQINKYSVLDAFNNFTKFAM